MTVSLEEAKEKLEELLEAARGGENIVLTRDGEEIGEIIAPRRKREFGSGKGSVWMAPDFDAPLEDFKDYM